MACRSKTADAPEARARLGTEAKRLHVDEQVRWVGETPAIHELLGLSDFVVLPNRSAYAKMDYPLAALEAMCMARPVIVASGTPAAELSEEGGAIAVEPSPDALADAVERIADDEQARKALGRRARELALQSFSPVKVAAAYERLYEELLG
jgi:glycosyltransferase involved in cell wall biosynthesis